MNFRVVFHVLNAVAGAVAGGTVALDFLPMDVQRGIVSIAALVVIGVSAALAATSTGISAPLRRSK